MNVVDRVTAIIVRPRQEWEVIRGEQTSATELYRSYVVLLAAIGPIATFIGVAVFGIGVPFLGTVRVPIGTAVAQAVVTYALTLAGTYVFALVIDALAPTFSGTKSSIQALKVAVYGSTAGWLAGIFSLIPALSFLGILGLYSIYLLYLGLPVLMGAPRERALPYTVVAVIAVIVIYVVIGAVAGFFISPSVIPGG